MPQYIILAPTSCTCKTELSDEKSVQDDNKLADCRKRNNLSGMQLRPNQMWYELIFHYIFFRFAAAKELSDIRRKSYKHLCTFYTIFRAKDVPLHSAAFFLCQVPSRLKLRWIEAYMQHGLQKIISFSRMHSFHWYFPCRFSIIAFLTCNTLTQIKNIKNKGKRKFKHPKLFERKLRQVLRIKDITYAQARIRT